MRFVKRIAAPILIAAVVSANAQTVCAGNVTSVLKKYNAGIERVNTEELESGLAEAVSEYSRIASEYRKKQSMVHTVDLTAKLIRDNIQTNDVNAASVDLRRKEDYLTALVGVDAGLEKIFEAEKDYRESQKRLGAVLDVSGILAGRVESLNVYGDYIPDTDSEDVERAAYDLKEARDKLTYAKDMTDIGVTDNLEFPINYPASVTSPFGIRNNPFGGAGTEFHYGLDLRAPAGSEVTSLFNGAVAIAGYDGGLGNYAVIAHGREFQTLYAHLSELKVKTGDTVGQYDVIGLVGSTGRSTGPHLHLGVYINGQKVDPMKLFIKG